MDWISARRYFAGFLCNIPCRNKFAVLAQAGRYAPTKAVILGDGALLNV